MLKSFSWCRSRFAIGRHRATGTAGSEKAPIFALNPESRSDRNPVRKTLFNILVLWVPWILLAQGFAARAWTQSAVAPPPAGSVSPVYVLLPPVVATDMVSYRTQLQTTGNSSFEEHLGNAAKDHLRSLGHPILALNNLSDVAAADLIKQLEPLTSRLARGAINDEAQSILTRLAALPRHYVIAVAYMQIKNGPGRSWNSMTGAITSAMSSTLVQSALISTATGKILWKNEQFERRTYRPDESKFEKILDQLYSTLGNGGGNL